MLPLQGDGEQWHGTQGEKEAKALVSTCGRAAKSPPQPLVASPITMLFQGLPSSTFSKAGGWPPE